MLTSVRNCGPNHRSPLTVSIISMGFTMADRRSARARSTNVTSAGAPYELNRPENWTVEKLREELRRNNVTFRHSDKKSVLLKKVKDLITIESSTVATYRAGLGCF